MDLQPKLAEITAPTGATWGIAVHALGQGAPVYINPDEFFPMASVFKVPVLVELMRQTALGRLALTDLVTVQAEDWVPGSGVLLEMTPGLPVALRDLAYLMTVISDNVAADLITRALGGPEVVGAALMQLGYPGIRLNTDCFGLLSAHYGLAPTERGATARAELRRRVEAGERDVENPLVARVTAENAATPRDLARLLADLETGTLLSGTYRDEALRILKKQQLNQRLPLYLPPLPFAHKTGTLHGIRNDAGILYLESGPVVICTLVKNVPATPGAGARVDQAMGAVAQAVFTAYAR